MQTGGVNSTVKVADALAAKMPSIALAALLHAVCVSAALAAPRSLEIALHAAFKSASIAVDVTLIFAETSKRVSISGCPKSELTRDEKSRAHCLGKLASGSHAAADIPSAAKRRADTVLRENLELVDE